MRPLAIAVSNILRTIMLSIFLLFCVLVTVLTLVFRELNELVSTEHFSLFCSARALHERLEKWRRNHTIACELVELVNKCFGPMCLIIATNVFVKFVTTSFEIVRFTQENDTLPPLFVFILLKKSIMSVILVYQPYRLQAEVGIPICATLNE